MRSKNLISRVATVLLLAALFPITACTTTQTASVDGIEGRETLALKAGDEIRIITNKRERLKLVITAVTVDAIEGRTMDWKASGVPAGQGISLAYDELAFVQVDRPSPGKTTGLVASLTLLGAMVAAVVVGPAPVMH